MHGFRLYWSQGLHFDKENIQMFMFSLTHISEGLNTISSVKLLGVYLDTSLKWGAHVDYLAA